MHGPDQGIRTESFLHQLARKSTGENHRCQRGKSGSGLFTCGYFRHGLTQEGRIFIKEFFQYVRVNGIGQGVEGVYRPIIGIVAREHITIQRIIQIHQSRGISRGAIATVRHNVDNLHNLNFKRETMHLNAHKTSEKILDLVKEIEAILSKEEMPDSKSYAAYIIEKLRPIAMQFRTIDGYCSAKTTAMIDTIQDFYSRNKRVVPPRGIEWLHDLLERIKNQAQIHQSKGD